ncbi:hypothetical protein [Vreelandella populi]|uniref:hypothetical protein n=1 Tax=Vreelandella populi TaxID=2498858 RepID=UPI0030ED80DB
MNSKLRGCDLVNLRVRDIAHGVCISPRAIVMQQKTHRPVQFEITEQTRIAIFDWIQLAQLRSEDSPFPSRINSAKHLSTRQHARIMKAWITEIGLDASMYGTYTRRRTKASLIYRRTKNLGQYNCSGVTQSWKWQNRQKFDEDKRRPISGRRCPAISGLGNALAIVCGGSTATVESLTSFSG